MAQADGITARRPQAVLVSDNPYQLSDLAGLGRRARLDTGRLGMVAVSVDSAREAVGLLRHTRDHGLTVLETPEVVVTADTAQIPVGDRRRGRDAADPGPVLDPAPGALRVRVPRDRPGVPPPRPALSWVRLVVWRPTTVRHGPDAACGGLDRWRRELGALDLAVYDAVAGTPSPTIDAGLARISNAANHSRLWVVTAGVVSLFGTRTSAGPRGRPRRRGRHLGRRQPRRQARAGRGRPERTESSRTHKVRMPESHSFPSGHAASAFAFSSALGAEIPPLATPLRLMATTVAYSRVHTGVHYPGDVVIGALIGAGLGTGTRLRRTSRRGQWEMTIFSTTIKMPSTPARAVTPNSRPPDSPASTPAEWPWNSSSSTVAASAA